MKQMARDLNLAPHYCGMKSQSKKLLCSAADIEGHLGKDGKVRLLLK
jgi:hypothetical protein